MDKLSKTSEPVEITALAEHIVSAMAAPAWRQNKVQIALEHSRSELWATADGQRLRQALVNLLHYAVEHTPPGGVILIVLQSGESIISISVQDTGESLPPEHLPHIWERPDQGRYLSVAKVLIESMGGRVTVDSPPGEGKRFTITLPRYVH